MGTAADLVIFGASGDLTHRKILPSLGHLVTRDGIPVRIIGVGRSRTSTEDFRAAVKQESGNQRLSANAEWVQLDYSEPSSFNPLKELVTSSPTVIFYLATPPETFSAIVAGLALSGLAKKADANRRIVVEKPFGHNLASAHKLNAELAAAFEEEQIFRIDHYLAKDTVQNVMALRFSNSLFEPVWNRTLIETILITVAEEEGIGKRAGYYDQTGAVRDIIQNHMLQLLALITMEPPTTLDPVRNLHLPFAPVTPDVRNSQQSKKTKKGAAVAAPKWRRQNELGARAHFGHGALHPERWLVWVKEEEKDRDDDADDERDDVEFPD